VATSPETSSPARPRVHRLRTPALKQPLLVGQCLLRQNGGWTLSLAPHPEAVGRSLACNPRARQPRAGNTEDLPSIH